MKSISYLIILVIYITMYFNEISGQNTKFSPEKEFISVKSLKKMMKAISATQTAAAMIDEIGMQDHQNN